MRFSSIVLSVFLGYFLFCASSANASQFDRISMPSGFSFLYEHDPFSEITVLQIAVKGGKRAEGVLPGLAWTTVKLALEPHSIIALNEMMELGVGLSTRVYGDFSLITLRVLSARLPKALALVRKSLFDPLINSVRLDSITRNREHHLNFMMDSPDALAYLAQLKAFFPDDPYHHNEYGVRDSVEKIRVSDVKAYYSTFFPKNNLVMAVSTDLTSEVISGHFNKMLVKVPSGSTPAVPNLRVSTPPAAPVAINKERVQSVISAAWLLPAKTAEERMSGFFLKTLLADGVGSKLWALRSEENLIYSSTSELLQMPDRVLLMVSLRCDDRNKERVLAEMDQVLKNILENGITADEFQQTRSYAQTTFFRDSENKEEKCYWAVLQEVLGIKADFLGCFEALSSEISLEAFNRYLGDVLASGKRSLVVVGPSN